MIRVAADGTFLWSRLLRSQRGLTAYISCRETLSNVVYWRRVR